MQIPRTRPRDRGARRQTGAADRLRAGEDFAQIARIESDDLLTRADGGESGWASRGTLPPEVEEVVFTMQPSDLRGPLYSDKGAHIVQVLERKDSAERPFDEIKEELRSQSAQGEVERARRAWLAEVRSGSYVDVRF